MPATKPAVRGGRLRLKGRAVPYKDTNEEEKPKANQEEQRKPGEAPQQQQATDDESEDEIIKELLADSTLTDAQRSHRLVQRTRETQKAVKALQRTHRQRVDEFNQKLSQLPEHFDVPRVGPG